MPFGFIGRVSSADQLKSALDVSSQRSRLIAGRVAQASLQQPNGGFAIPAPNAAPGSTEQGPIDLEGEMASLADEQLRYEATAKLLQSTYQRIRTSMRDR